MTDTIAALDGPVEPIIITKPAHPISQRDIDPDALKILFWLYRQGFTAYLTGGAVRDLMLGKPAKDFDIVTDARPGQIKKRFASAYVIGRRFRLAHIHFSGGKIIEVATFRRTIEPNEDKAPEDGTVPASPYGTPGEDAFRRDITINALFYDVITDTVIDYVGGLADLSRRTVRVIGDPMERFREDPVRIWRVLRHSARLGFTIEEATEKAIPSQIHLLSSCSGARLYEEFNKDLAYETRPVIEALRKYGLLGRILGKIGAAYEDDAGLFSRLRSLLDIEDRAGMEGHHLSLEEMYALVFWPWMGPLLAEKQMDLHKSLSDAFRDAGMRVAVPKSLRANVIQIMIIVKAMIQALRTGRMRWSLQQRAHYRQASRLFFLVFKERPAEKEETFEKLFQQAFPAGPKRWRRRGRRPSYRFPKNPL
jgi:poly(A) polymerase